MYKTHLGALVGSFEWVFSHCQLLGVLEGRVWVKILKVFHRVLSDTQAPDSGLGLVVKICARHICLICVLVFISITVITVVTV